MKLLATSIALSLTALTIAAPTPIDTTLSTRQISCEEVQETPNGPWSVVCPVKREPAVCEEVQETPNGPWSVVCQPSPHTERSTTIFASRQIACEEVQETPNGPWSVVCPVAKRSLVSRQSDEPAIEQENIAAGFAPPKNTKTGEKRSPVTGASSTTPQGCHVKQNCATCTPVTVCPVPGDDEPAIEQQNISAGFAPPNNNTKTGVKRSAAAHASLNDDTKPGSDEPTIEQNNIAAGFAPPKDTKTGEKRSSATDPWLNPSGCFLAQTCANCTVFTVCSNSGPPSAEQENTAAPSDEPAIEQNNISAGFAPPKNTTTGEKRGMPVQIIKIIGPVDTAEKDGVAAGTAPWMDCTSHSTNTTSTPTKIPI